MDRLIGLWQTPGGRTAVVNYRDGTSDWNTVSSVMAPHDEYRLPTGLTGWAVDIGAHVGAVTVALALDNPGIRVVAIEPVPPNADLLRANVEANGLTERVIVLENAAGVAGPVDVWWGYRGTVSAEHHAYIGNSSIAYAHGGEIAHETTTYPEPVSLSWLAAYLHAPIAWCKLDAEGAEWDLLRDPAIRAIRHLTGEYHPVRGMRRADLLPLLEPTHTVTLPDPPAGVDPEIGPGPFVAVLR